MNSEIHDKIGPFKSLINGIPGELFHKYNYISPIKIIPVPNTKSDHGSIGKTFIRIGGYWIIVFTIQGQIPKVIMIKIWFVNGIGGFQSIAQSCTTLIGILIIVE